MMTSSKAARVTRLADDRINVHDGSEITTRNAKKSVGAKPRGVIRRIVATASRMESRLKNHNADGAVTRLEAQGDINFLPRLDDMEINMDGVVTMAELQRYLERTYGAQFKPIASK